MSGGERIACIGGGVIGGGWVARWLLNGHDVTVHDPHPEAERIIREVLANATRAWERLLLAPLPEPGRLSFAPDIAGAVAGASLIHESVPERLEVKHAVIAAIEAAAAPEAVIASSTSGFRPSELRQGARHPGRIFVAHPFNPVYLLPVVELVGRDGGAPEALARLTAALEGAGMKPVLIGTEIDAHVGDRLLEAVWREALWLVRDGVATTQEIDDIIRYGFGLRWAQMGLFETYRIAGGEAGMRHFMAQFGPALAWPWSRLTDVPPFDEALVELIASQSDAQSGAHGIRELERIRDDNLAAIMTALKGTGWGAGEVLRDWENRLYAAAHAPEAPGDGRLPPYRGRVPGDWVDYNGHMTESRYLQAFGDATDGVLAAIGCDAAHRAAGFSVYTVESHIRHLREAHAGDRFEIRSRILGRDAKRLRVLHRMLAEDGTELATGEHMMLHVDMGAGRAVPFPEAMGRVIDGFVGAEQGEAVPDYAGAGIRAV